MDENAIPGAPDEFVHVFVSYAREDRRWLDPDYRFSLIPFLMESLRRHKVAFWFDKELKPGDEFKRHIESQIDQSQIALLIVSQSFLNSEFIENREIPRIAERARLGKMIVVPVLVEPCDWSEYPFLADRQMVPSSPLIEYTESEPQWVKVRFQILDGLKAQVKRIRETPRPVPAAEAETAAIEPPPQPASQPMQEVQREPEGFAAATTPEQGPQAAEPLTAEFVATTAGPPEVARVEAYVAADEAFEEGLHAANQAREYAEADAPYANTFEPTAPARAKVRPTPRRSVAAEEVRAESALASSDTVEEGLHAANLLREYAEAVVLTDHMADPAPRNWTSAVLGGAVLVGVVALVLLRHTLSFDWFLSVMGGAPLAAALVCLLIFKPFPRNWSLAAVGGAALVSAVWVRIAFAGWIPLIWTFLFMDGAALALVLVCLRVFRPFPRNWAPAAVGGVIFAGLLASPYLWFLSRLPLWLVMVESPLAMVLLCFLVFKPFPRNWTPAVVCGAALASAMWAAYAAFFGRFPVIWTLAVTGGAALAAVFVCHLVFKPYPHNRIPDLVGGAALVSAVLIYHVFLRGFSDISTPAVLDEAALAMLLVCLLVSRAREKT